jgi:MerR family transcriptional regulator, thiopeptide resistance regulator
VCGFWTPNRASYAGLGELYVEDERFAASYEKVRPGLAAYMREAMKEYARQRLS